MTALEMKLRQLWETSQGPPDLFAFVSRHRVDDPHDLLPLVLCDQRYRWRTGSPFTVTDYLSHLPDLRSDAESEQRLREGEAMAKQQTMAIQHHGNNTSREQTNREQRVDVKEAEAASDLSPNTLSPNTTSSRGQDDTAGSAPAPEGSPSMPSAPATERIATERSVPTDGVREGTKENGTATEVGADAIQPPATQRSLGERVEQGTTREKDDAGKGDAPGNPTQKEYRDEDADLSSVSRLKLLGSGSHRGQPTQDAEKTLHHRDSDQGGKRLQQFQEGDLIGRYRLDRELGKGGFGRVFKAYDEQLRRHVAIKFPVEDRIFDAMEAALFEEEAQTVARLDHPHIVPVYDMGTTEDGRIFVVSKLIRGENLFELLKENVVTVEMAVLMARQVADALHYSHQQRLIHRDVKPGNILMEQSSGQFFLTDFGLAMHEDSQLQRMFQAAGTPMYMSPEQIRGEIHRLDASSDLFSLGIVFYEALTRQRPFPGSTRKELEYQLLNLQPLAPSELNEEVPEELDRICQRAIAPRHSERYESGALLAEDLQQWQRPARKPALRITPRGLRSFEAADSAFFLDLLPGPRDRDYLPESVKFWKQRIQVEPQSDGEPHAESPFAVGLVVGPSGCGKSSFVKAGLLPNLDASIRPVYVEASADETEARLIRHLRKVVPDVDFGEGLTPALMELRQRDWTPHPFQKVLLVIDQFEQWLSAHPIDLSDQLVQALRQCDGVHVQVIVMVRDDFAMASARFMDVLDIPIEQGKNFATVDLFDMAHAKKVLFRFGQAFERLPKKRRSLTETQEEFLDEVIESLANNGKVVSVHLSLFAEMIKGKEWNRQTLQEVGGAEGVGVAFLDETFSGPRANPRHVQYAESCQAILKALLPSETISIKGQMQSQEELRLVAGCENDPGKFAKLLSILDGELRLITPTDPISLYSDSQIDHTNEYYQLTHDYLVPSLREWLNRQRKDTPQGRADLILEERAAVWERKPETRYLPSLFEYLNILRYTNSQQWGTSQRRLMARSRTTYGTYFVMGLIAVLLLLLASYSGYRAVDLRQQQAETRAEIQRYLDAEVRQLPNLFAGIEQRLPYSQEVLETALQDPALSEEHALRARVALVNQPEQEVQPLVEALLRCKEDFFQVSINRVRPTLQRSTIADELWKQAEQISPESAENNPVLARRLGLLLTLVTPEATKWDSFVVPFTKALVLSSKEEARFTGRYLSPVQDRLREPLETVFRSQMVSDTRSRVIAAELLCQLLPPGERADLLLEAEADQFLVLIQDLEQPDGQLLRHANERLQSRDPDATYSKQKTVQCRNAVLLKLLWGDAGEIQAYLTNRDPNLRTAIMLNAGEFQIPLHRLTGFYRAINHPVARQALLLMMNPSRFRDNAGRGEVLDLCRDVQANSVHLAEVSAARWVLEQWGRAGDLVDTVAQPPGADWYVTKGGPALRMIRTPGTVMVGSKDADMVEDSRAEAAHEVTIDHAFGIAVTELTIQDYNRFARETGRELKMGEPRMPATRIDYFDATAYCRWLSGKEGIPQDEWFYDDIDREDPAKEIPKSLTTDQLLHRGFRLPTADEWEYTCGMGRIHQWSFGDEISYLPSFAWYQRNSPRGPKRVALLLPSVVGLFDMHGNLRDRVHRAERRASLNQFWFKGGCFSSDDSDTSTAAYYAQDTAKGYSFMALRVAQTLLDDGATVANLPTDAKKAVVDE